MGRKALLALSLKVLYRNKILNNSMNSPAHRILQHSVPSCPSQHMALPTCKFFVVDIEIDG